MDSQTCFPFSVRWNALIVLLIDLLIVFRVTNPRCSNCSRVDMNFSNSSLLIAGAGGTRIFPFLSAESKAAISMGFNAPVICLLILSMARLFYKRFVLLFSPIYEKAPVIGKTNYKKDHRPWNAKPCPQIILLLLDLFFALPLGEAGEVGGSLFARTRHYQHRASR